jgi:hypothetical protein
MRTAEVHKMWGWPKRGGQKVTVRGKMGNLLAACLDSGYLCGLAWMVTVASDRISGLSKSL